MKSCFRVLIPAIVTVGMPARASEIASEPPIGKQDVLCLGFGIGACPARAGRSNNFLNEIEHARKAVRAKAHLTGTRGGVNARCGEGHDQGLSLTDLPVNVELARPRQKPGHE